MFFKSTQTKRNNRKIALTEEFCKAQAADSKNISAVYTDTICRGLRLYVGKYGTASYSLVVKTHQKVIGSVFSVSLKEAREIVNNIRENYSEYMLANIPSFVPLFNNIKEFGYFPRKDKKKGTNIILSDENASLKEKIKDLQIENESLKDEIKKLSEENRKYYSWLITIRKVVGEVYEDNTEVTD